MTLGKYRGRTLKSQERFDLGSLFFIPSLRVKRSNPSPFVIPVHTRIQLNSKPLQMEWF